MSSLSIPTTSALPSTQRIPSEHPAVAKTLGRLSRPSLLSLALDWLDERNQQVTAPYIIEEESEIDVQDLYPPASSLEALREIYTDLQSTKGSKRDVVDRIVEGDWRDGITLYQLAMADMQYLYDHPTSQKWTALKIVRLENDTPNSKPHSIPRFHPATFLRNLQNEILPDVKAHYNLDRHKSLPLLILRVFIVESPYNTSLALSQKQTFDSSKTFYIAFPDDAPFVYVSLTTASQPPGQPVSRADNKSLRRLTLEGVPKAFSRPRERYKLESTNLSARSLATLVDRRGGGRTNSAGGGWSVYTKEKGGDNPLKLQLPTPTPEPEVSDKENEGEILPIRGLKRGIKEDERIVKRRKALARVRFADTAKDDEKGIEKLVIRILDPFPMNNLEDHEYSLADELGDEEPVKKKGGRKSGLQLELEKQAEEEEVDPPEDEFRPQIDFEFNGEHVFAGIRELVELGVIDGERMPGWMTGEDGVSVGRVRNGRIAGNRGVGL